MRSLLRCAPVLVVLALAGTTAAQSVPPAEDVRRVERLVATIAHEAATLCPLADPGDQGDRKSVV